VGIGRFLAASLAGFGTVAVSSSATARSYRLCVTSDIADRGAEI
jgi:hypothetical protein